MPISHQEWREYILLFTVGAVWDSILSLDTIFTSQFAWFPTFWSTFIESILPFWAFSRIMEEKQINWAKALTLALGSSFGAAITTYILGLIYR